MMINIEISVEKTSLFTRLQDCMEILFHLQAQLLVDKYFIVYCHHEYPDTVKEN